jgi:hypothetical protein
MVRFNDMTNQFSRRANVGNPLSVLSVVITVISKPVGATMV